MTKKKLKELIGLHKKAMEAMNAIESEIAREASKLIGEDCECFYQQSDGLVILHDIEATNTAPKNTPINYFFK